MKLQQLLQLLDKTAVENNISTPYIVGGIPRNILLDVLNNLNDIDVTTGGQDVHRLADFFAQRLNVEAKILKDGHKKVMYKGISIDFSSAFHYDNIDSMLSAMDVDPITDLVRETYSRDFTVNTLLTPLDFSEIIDLTGKGVVDVENRILRCPVNCNLAFRESPIRMIRAFYYSARYNLKIPQDLRRGISNNIDLLDEVDDKYKVDKISSALKNNPDILDDLIELGVLNKIPLSKEMSKILIEKKRLTEVL